jgi:uncharacterized Ntn-hydrolase superfamily protein
MAGNSNSGRKRNTFVTDALVIEMKAREADGDKRGMRAVAVKIWDEAEKGERWAAEFIRDTVDGKPVQAVEGELDLGVKDSLGELLMRIATKGNPLVAPDDSAT